MFLTNQNSEEALVVVCILLCRKLRHQSNPESIFPHLAFSSPEAALLLVSTKNLGADQKERGLWGRECPIWEKNGGVLSMRTPVRVQPLLGVERKESSGTGLESDLH